MKVKVEEKFANIQRNTEGKEGRSVSKKDKEVASGKENMCCVSTVVTTAIKQFTDKCKAEQRKWSGTGAGGGKR